MERKERIYQIWSELSDSFPDKESQLKKLCCGSKKNFECSHCQSTRVELMKEEGRCLKCRDCNSKTWITSSTFFRGIRKPLPYLAAIYFLEYGIALNSVELSILANVTQSTAWEIIKKISLIANASMPAQGERVSVRHIVKAIYKRSRKTPRDCHPAQELEQETEEDKTSTAITISMLESDDARLLEQNSIQRKLAEQDRVILEAIGQSPLHADEICSNLKLGPSRVLPSLTILELDGLIESVAGNRYRRKLLNPVSDEPNYLSLSQNAGTMIGATIEFARSVYRGISKKYSQLYVALLWMVQEGEKQGWLSILARCRKFDHFDKSSITKFVTGKYLVMPHFRDSAA